MVNLEQESRNASTLIIWTDCDREGEHIGYEIANICRQSNQQINVFRARYSVINERELKRAANSLLRLDTRQVDAVLMRMELDLRGGAAFTRYLTLLLKEKYSLTESFISYGTTAFSSIL